MPRKCWFGIYRKLWTDWKQHLRSLLILLFNLLSGKHKRMSAVPQELSRGVCYGGRSWLYRLQLSKHRYKKKRASILNTTRRGKLHFWQPKSRSARFVGSTNSTSPATQTATSGGNGINGCPPFPKNCDSACVQLNDMGCVICSCSRMSLFLFSLNECSQIGNYKKTKTNE